MTLEQAEQFLKEIKGRKIRMSAWDKDYYVIPTGTWLYKTHKNPYSWKFECINPNNSKTWYCIWEGFSKDNYRVRWEYFPDFETYLELLDL